jgi:hypothetical protein
MGGFFKSKTTNTQQPFEQNPWEPQQDYLKDGFKKAGTSLGQAQQQFGAIKDYTADLNGGQTKAISDLTRFGNGTTQNVANTSINTGLDGMRDFGKFGNNAGELYNTAMRDPTGKIMQNGQAYAENPYLQGQIDASLNDVNKAFQRDQASINSGAVATGNINSTRAGALEARAMDDAMDRGAAISSQMRGNAYESGLDRAMVTNQNQFDNGMGANASFLQSGLAGYDMAQGGVQTGQAGYESALGSQGILQQQNQNEIEGQLRKAGVPQELVAQYMATVGGSYGQQGFQTSTSTQQSPFQTLIGGAASLAGAGFKLPGMG